jgi:hypothetical protein
MRRETFSARNALGNAKLGCATCESVCVPIPLNLRQQLTLRGCCMPPHWVGFTGFGREGNSGIRWWSYVGRSASGQGGNAEVEGRN